MVDQNQNEFHDSQRDDLNTPLIALIGFLSAIITFVLIIAMQVMYFSMQDAEYYNKVVSQKPAELTRVISKQQEQLYGPYRWVDESKGIVAIPITDAMQLVVNENQ